MTRSPRRSVGTNSPTSSWPTRRSCHQRAASSPTSAFSIQAKRSEVLFVDYMAEHLTPTGRAGIIVLRESSSRARPPTWSCGNRSSRIPRRRRFPSGRMLQSYSGVKTSILILDKSLAREATPSPSSKWRTTASVSAPSGAPSRRMISPPPPPSWKLISTLRILGARSCHPERPLSSSEIQDRREWRLQPQRRAVSGRRGCFFGSMAIGSSWNTIPAHQRRDSIEGERCFWCGTIPWYRRRI